MRQSFRNLGYDSINAGPSASVAAASCSVPTAVSNYLDGLQQSAQLLASDSIESGVHGTEERLLGLGMRGVDFNEAIKVNSHRPEAYVNRGLIQLQQGNKAKAERDFARSIALKPSVKPFIEQRIGQISQR